MTLFRIIFCLSVFVLFNHQTANASNDIVEDVKAFYMDFVKLLSDNNKEDLIALTENVFADDFDHWDDGAFSYSKADLLKTFAQAEARSETRVRFDIASAVYDEDIHAVILEFTSNSYSMDMHGDEKLVLSIRCLDTLPVSEDGTFQLKKCDCKTLVSPQDNRKF